MIYIREFESLLYMLIMLITTDVQHCAEIKVTCSTVDSSEEVDSCWQLIGWCFRPIACLLQ